jgi:RNA polymerase sigma factor (sigma-70 family)
MHDARDADDRRLLEAGEFSRLVESYYGLVVGRCCARIQTGDALDVASEIVMRLLTELKAGKTYGDLPYRVVVNQIVRWTIGGYFAGRRYEAELPELDSGSDPWAGVDSDLDLAATIADLPEREQQVAMLWLFGGLGAAEIAPQLGIEPNNVHQIVHRIKKRLRLAAEAA